MYSPIHCGVQLNLILLFETKTPKKNNQEQ